MNKAGTHICKSGRVVTVGTGMPMVLICTKRDVCFAADHTQLAWSTSELDVESTRLLPCSVPRMCQRMYLTLMIVHAKT